MKHKFIPVLFVFLFLITLNCQLFAQNSEISLTEYNYIGVGFSDTGYLKTQITYTSDNNLNDKQKKNNGVLILNKAAFPIIVKKGNAKNISADIVEIKGNTSENKKYNKIGNIELNVKQSKYNKYIAAGNISVNGSKKLNITAYLNVLKTKKSGQPQKTDKNKYYEQYIGFAEKQNSFSVFEMNVLTPVNENNTNNKSLALEVTFKGITYKGKLIAKIGKTTFIDIFKPASTDKNNTEDIMQIPVGHISYTMQNDMYCGNLRIQITDNNKQTLDNDISGVYTLYFNDKP